MEALDHDGSGLLCYVALTLQLMDLKFSVILIPGPFHLWFMSLVLGKVCG